MRHNIQIPIFQYSVENWETVKPEILSLLQKFKGSRKNRSKGSETYYLSGTDVETDFFLYRGASDPPPYALDMMKYIKPCIQQFKEDAGIADIPYELDGFWYELAEKGEWHGLHDHGTKGISAVFFVEMDEGQYPTEFKGEFGEQTFSPPAKEGDLLFFPSWMKHRGGQNTIDKGRTIVSFNMKRKATQQDIDDPNSFYHVASVHI